MIKPKLRVLLKRSLATLIWSILGIYGLNAAVIGFSQPMNIQQGQQGQELETVQGIKVIGFKNLTSGGIPVNGMNRLAGGYVNMSVPDETLYVNTSIVHKQVSGRTKKIHSRSYLFRHEYAHILQKQATATQAGGYPSYWNPIQSIKYYVTLLQLNAYYEDVMPKVTADETFMPFTTGLEAAAECYAQPIAGEYKAPYLNGGHCTEQQRQIAVSLILNKWPLQPDENSQISPESNPTHTNDFR